MTGDLGASTRKEAVAPRLSISIGGKSRWTLDPTRPDGNKILHALIATADIFRHEREAAVSREDGCRLRKPENKAPTANLRSSFRVGGMG